MCHHHAERFKYMNSLMLRSQSCDAGTVLFVLQKRKLWLRGMNDAPNISQQSSELMPVPMPSPCCPILGGLVKTWHREPWRRQRRPAGLKEEAGATAISQPECAGASDWRPESGPSPARVPSTPTSSLPSLCQMLSHVWLFVTPWTVPRQAPLSVEFSRQEYWSNS